MSLARFHHLTLQAREPERMGAFWATALGFERTDDPDSVTLRGAGPQDLLEILPTDAPRGGHYRWHMDLHAEDVDALVAAGGHVSDDHAPWVVMHCPEGREIGVLLTDQMAGTDTDRFYQLVIDSPEPEAIAAWWARLLKTTLREVPDDPDVAFIEPIPAAPFESIVFARESEPKTEPNSMWMTVTTYDTQALEYAGARLLDRYDDGRVRMADPDGNEFDVITLRR